MCNGCVQKEYPDRVSKENWDLSTCFDEQTLIYNTSNNIANYLLTRVAMCHVN